MCSRQKREQVYSTCKWKGQYFVLLILVCHFYRDGWSASLIIIWQVYLYNFKLISVYPVGPSRLTRIFRLWKALSGSTCLERSWLKTWSRSWRTRIIHKLLPLWWGWKSLSLRWINHLTRRERSRILEARSKVRMRCSRSPLKRREVRTTRTTIHFELKSITCHNDFCHF